MGGGTRTSAIARIEELSRRGDDLVSFWRAATETIERAVPFYSTPCYYTLDPASLLATSHFHEGLPEIPGEWLALEYAEEDLNKMADVVRSPRGMATLDEATDGDLSRSRKYQMAMEPLGADQEAIIGLRTHGGEIWGALTLYRAPGHERFATQELEFLKAASVHLAEGARRALLIGEAREPDGPDSPGLLVLDDRFELESATTGVDRWIAELPGGDLAAGRLPACVLSVAGQALRSSEQPDCAGEVAFARVLSSSGRWVLLHGAPLVSEGRRRAAVIVEPAHPARIAPLLMSAYGLTEREQEVTRLVLQGDSTSQIAEALVVSPHTVQEHLKSIFEKTGVRSRRDLVGKVFFAHYEPRLRENEGRALEGQPLRGGPMPPVSALDRLARAAH